VHPAAVGATAMCSLDILIAGKYRLGRKLGGGSFGEIFLGTNLQTGEEVGIKLVSGQHSAPPLLVWAKQRNIHTCRVQMNQRTWCRPAGLLCRLIAL
jgi:serine/threonine protein kinase